MHDPAYAVKLAEFFAASDANGDGKLDFNELMNFYKTMECVYSEKGGVVTARTDEQNKIIYDILNKCSEGDGVTFAEWGACMGQMEPFIVKLMSGQ